MRPGGMGCRYAALKLAAHRKRIAHIGKDPLSIKGLLDKIQSARPHGAHGKRHIAIARHDDHGNADSPADKLLLKRKPVHVGHTDIDDETPRRRRRQARKKFPCRPVILDRVAGRLQKRA